ncbi:MAG: MBL fold metallo-hydrolase [Candidatus Auribacterota bacterium]
MKLTIAIFTILIAAGITMTRTHSYYTGKKSGHFDGTKFFNPWNRDEKSFFDVLKWKFTRDEEPWPDTIGSFPKHHPQESVDSGHWRASFVTHATVLLQTGKVNILTDPIWSERASPVQWAGPKRTHEPGIDFDHLPAVDIVLISHSHYDHLDIPTLRKLRDRFNPEIYCGLGLDAYLKKYGIPAVAMDWKQSVNTHGITITFQPVQHWSGRTLFDRNKTLWGGFVIESPAGTVFFAGDTGYMDFKPLAQQYGAFALAMLPIGAYEPRWFMKYSHMNPEEAVQAHLDLNAKYSMAIHFRTFQLSDEAIGRPEKDMETALKKLSVSNQRFIIPVPGESLLIPSDDLAKQKI